MNMKRLTNLAGLDSRLISCIVATVIFQATLAEAGSQCKRNLTTTVLCPSALYDNCTQENGSFINLVYTRADGPNDTIHFLYSTRGIPSVLVARTPLNAALSVNYSRFINDSVESTKNCVNFGVPVMSAFVIMLPQLIEYKDTQDTANMEEVNYTLYTYDLSAMQWNSTSVHTLVDQHLVIFELDRGQKPLVNNNGSISLRFRAYCNNDYSAELPNLQYTSNMSLADLVLDNVDTVDNTSRFAVTLVLATTSNLGGNMTISVLKSIDDEHSPGSFATIDWQSGQRGNETQAFVQWKPACYNDPMRSIHSLSRSRYYALQPFGFKRPQLGLAYSFFGDAVLANSSINMATINVSFGLPLDNFYRKTPYITWSFSFGLGNPPQDSISFLIILIICIGLGIPVLLIIGGCVYTCVRKFRHREGYVEITDSYSEIN